jgi:hypothetical protein
MPTEARVEKKQGRDADACVSATNESKKERRKRRRNGSGGSNTNTVAARGREDVEGRRERWEVEGKEEGLCGTTEDGDKWLMFGGGQEEPNIFQQVQGSRKGESKQPDSRLSARRVPGVDRKSLGLHFPGSCM